MRIEKVEMFETVDGERHVTLEKAQEYIADQCREVLDRHLSPLVASGQFTANERYKIIMQLVPDAAAAEVLTSELRRRLG